MYEGEHILDKCTAHGGERLLPFLFDHQGAVEAWNLPDGAIISLVGCQLALSADQTDEGAGIEAKVSC